MRFNKEMKTSYFISGLILVIIGVVFPNIPDTVNGNYSIKQASDICSSGLGTIGTMISGQAKQACYNVSIIYNVLIVAIIIGAAFIIYGITSKK